MGERLSQALELFEKELQQNWVTWQVGLVRYAQSLLKGKYLGRGRLPEGMDVEDVVIEAVKKTLAGLKTTETGKGLRKWDPAKCSLYNFLCGTIKSDISDLVNRKDNQNQDLPDDDVGVYETKESARFLDLMSALENEVREVNDKENVIRIIRAAEKLSKMTAELSAENLRDASGLNQQEFKNAKRTLDRAVQRILERRQ